MQSTPLNGITACVVPGGDDLCDIGQCLPVMAVELGMYDVEDRTSLCGVHVPQIGPRHPSHHGGDTLYSMPATAGDDGSNLSPTFIETLQNNRASANTAAAELLQRLGDDGRLSNTQFNRVVSLWKCQRATVHGGSRTASIPSEAFGIQRKGNQLNLTPINASLSGLRSVAQQIFGPKP